MKFSLAFLCALVVISHQQMQKPRGLVWFSPYYSLTNPSPVINNYPSQYYGSHPDDESLFFRNLRIAYPQEELIDDQMNKHNIDEYPRSRFTGFYQPSFSQQQQNARLFFGGAIANSFMRTATFTVTSTLSVTSVQPCIPASQFAIAGPVTSSAACRRRKRQTLEAFDSSEDTQFLIHPSKTNQVIPTALVPLIKDGQLGPGDEQARSTDNAGIISSKDEISQLKTHDQLSTLSNSQDKNTRDKRFFFMNGIISTTVTQYSIISIISTKTLAGGLAAGGALLCLPPGIIVCPAAG